MTETHRHARGTLFTMSPEFLLTTLIIVITPGTGVLYTLAAGLSRGARASVIAAVGCTLGIVPHMLAAITGLAALLHASAIAFEIIKWPERQQRPRVGPSEHLFGGEDVEQCDTLDSLGVFESEAIADAPTPVVAGDEEPGIALPLHQADHVACHRRLGIRRVARRRFRFAARSIAAQVGADDGEVLR
jgi:hypothetical protein